METFKMPVSSYEELCKIIKAYGKGKVGTAISLDDLVKVSGMSKTVLSKNNGFLVQMKLITEGNKKAPTELCKKLVNANNLGLKEEICKMWKEIIVNDEFFNNLISFIEIKKILNKSDYIAQIVYVSGCNESPAYRTGASTIIEILKLAEVIEEDGENLVCTKECKEYEVHLCENEHKKVQSIEEKNEYKNDTYYTQQYTCESGDIAKIIIPQDVTEDDLLGFRDMLNIALKRKFKLDI